MAGSAERPNVLMSGPIPGTGFCADVSLADGAEVVPIPVPGLSLSCSLLLFPPFVCSLAC